MRSRSSCRNFSDNKYRATPLGRDCSSGSIKCSRMAASCPARSSAVGFILDSLSQRSADNQRSPRSVAGRDPVQYPMMEPTLESLKDLTLAIQQVEGFHPVVAALKNGRAATIDGAWNSSAALAAAALGLQTPHTLLVVLARPGDADPWCEDILSFAGVRPVIFPAW